MYSLRFGFHILWLRFGQARRARCPQIAQALDHCRQWFAKQTMRGRFSGWLISPNSLWIDTDQPARTALREMVIPHCLARSSPSHIRCRQFFPSKSFNTTLSSIVSASRRFSFLFFDHPDYLGFGKPALSHWFAPSKI